MSTLEQRLSTVSRPRSAAGSDESGVAVMFATIRREASNLASAGRAGVSRALSGNAQEYLKSALQTGGE